MMHDTDDFPERKEERKRNMLYPLSCMQRQVSQGTKAGKILLQTQVLQVNVMSIRNI